MVTRVRNLGCVPYLTTEGEIVKSLVSEERLAAGKDWHRHLKPYERMHNHHTLASVRRYAYFKPFSNLIPCDDLDFKLASPYDHGTDIFPVEVDVLIQPETLGQDTWRRLRNTRDIQPEKDAISAAAAKAALLSVSAGGLRGKKLEKYNEHHVVHIGGISERRHPSNVKLMNSSHHSPQTNAGYTRQDSDGNAYQY